MLREHAISECHQIFIKRCFHFVKHIVMGLTLVSVFCFADQLAFGAEKGRILSSKTNGDVFRRGDTIQVWVKVQSFQRGQKHHLVVLNIFDKNDRAIYDSHTVNEDIDFLISKNEVKTVGPFSYTWPSDLRRGVYRLFVGYRVHPWEPLIEFQGDKWHPPIRNVTLK